MEFLLIFMGLFFISAMFLGFDYIFEHTHSLKRWKRLKRAFRKFLSFFGKIFKKIRQKVLNESNRSNGLEIW